MDGSARVFVYELDRDDDKLRLASTIELPDKVGNSRLADPRGLAYACDNGHDIFYFLNWDPAGAGSQLWRSDFKDDSHMHIDLTTYHYRIGRRQVYDLAYDKGKLLICFDASGYKSNNLRVSRGIIQIGSDRANPGKFEFIKHMPDSGEFTSKGLAYMRLEGARYLWVAAGDDHVYSAQAETGRGVFCFDRPKATERGKPCLGLTFGDNALWVPEGLSGPDRVHRVNVTRNLDAFYEGPRILRHLVMTIRSEPEKECDNPGRALHYYSRPYSCGQLRNQGVWPDTEKVVDTSNASNSLVKPFSYDPAGDAAARQYMSLVEYAEAPARSYSSRYEVDIWTNAYRKYVYPHRVNTNADALAETDYLADDPNLFNLSDSRTYDGLTKRVRAHIKSKYHIEADMENPYWAARNVLEYIQDNYYYPGREQARPATVDYKNQHYDANPGNLKLALSDRPYDKTQITACSGTSVMLAGAMRYMGIQARWLGTGVQRGANLWDDNRNGILDRGESAPCSNGHRYSQVWLGSNYGWICFDATPLRPDDSDYDPAPPRRSQWQYMSRSARGHLLDKRIVFNIGSELFLPLYRDFEYDKKLAIDNNCGGDQRYNLQGRFDKPALWKLARHSISVENLCFIDKVTVSGPPEEMKIRWELEGPWGRDPQATLSLHLHQVPPATKGGRDIETLVKAIPYNTAEATVDLSGHAGRSYRIIIRKDGDSETGGQSQEFDL